MIYRLSIFLLAVLLTGCQSTEKTTEYSGVAMTIPYRIIVGAVLDEEREAVIGDVIRDVFRHVDEHYNEWNPFSEVSKLNKAGAGEKIAISGDLQRFLEVVGKVVELTGGRFDPTVHGMHRLWKSCLAEGRVPSEEEREGFVEAFGWKHVHFGEGVFWKDFALTSFDFGGIAKGYCIDLLAEALNAEGLGDIYVEWGGEIRCTGRHPEGRPWTVFISGLGDRDPAEAVDTVEIQDASLATSGDYLQSWTIQGAGPGQEVCYTHVMDPASLCLLEVTANSVASVSVLAESCTLSDGLATAVMTCGSLEAAQAWAQEVQEKLPQTQFWIVRR